MAKFEFTTSPCPLRLLQAFHSEALKTGASQAHHSQVQVSWAGLMFGEGCSQMSTELQAKTAYLQPSCH